MRWHAAETVWQDVRYGMRMIRRSPGLTAMALLTLALGTGANTAMFSIIHPLMLRALPVHEPGRLVQFVWQYPGDPPLNRFGPAHYQHYRDHNTVFAAVVGSCPVAVPVSDGRPAQAEFVTGNFFEALGVRPVLGRLLRPEDDQPGASPVAVVSWRYWQSQFSADQAFLETPVTIGDVQATLIGVAPRDFSGLLASHSPDVWLPAAAAPGNRPPGFMLTARLKDGVTIERARAEMRALDRSRIEELAQRDPQWLKTTFDVLPARTGLRTPVHDQFGRPLLALMAVVGALLLLACTNIASMLLARGAARQQEMAVRVSLGAGRARIVRQMLTESLLLSAAGSTAGVVLAFFSTDALVRVMVSGTRMIGPPPRLEVGLDWPVLMFTTAVAVLATLLFGLAPAWVAFSAAPAAALRGGGRSSQARSRRLFGNGLVVGQVALSVVILSAAALFARHLANLRERDLGFEPGSVLLVSLDSSRISRPRDQLPGLYKDLLGRFAAMAGVQAAALSGMTPISGAAGSRFVHVDGFIEPLQSRRRVSMNAVAPDYFATLGTLLVAGRDFEAADERRPRVVIVNRAMARYYFGDASPLGRHIRLDDDPVPYEIVGVVADAKYNDLREPAPRTFYLHAFQQRGLPSQFALRTTVPPASLAGDVRRVVADVLGSVPIARVTTLDEQVNRSIVPERLIATLSGFFGVLGILLSAIGLYGLLAYTVARRTTEIGVRLALGASRGDVARMVLGSAMGLVCAGLAIGIPAAIAAERFAASVFGNLPIEHLVPIASAAAIMIATTLLAAYLPARRAAAVDPVRALRAE